MRKMASISVQLGRSRYLLAVLCLAMGALSGCDLFGPDGTSVEGVVVDAETGEPVEDIWVTLRVCGGCVGRDSPVAADSTDARGRFSLDDPVERGSYPNLYANRVSYGEDVSDGAKYNPNYGIYRGGVESGQHHTVRIELRPAEEQRERLITNFHMPGSTLLMLVSAFSDRELMMHAYEQAIEHEYRLFSYGDETIIV